MRAEHVSKETMEDVCHIIMTFCHEHSDMKDIANIEKAIQYNASEKVLEIDEDAFYSVGNYTGRGDIPTGNYMLIAKCPCYKDANGEILEDKRYVEPVGNIVLPDEIRDRMETMSKTCYCAACKKTMPTRMVYCYIKETNATIDDFYQVGSGCCKGFEKSLNYINLLKLIKVRLGLCVSNDISYERLDDHYISVIELICRVNSFYYGMGIEILDKDVKTASGDAHSMANVMYRNDLRNHGKIFKLKDDEDDTTIVDRKMIPDDENMADEYSRRYKEYFSNAVVYLKKDLETIMNFYDTIGNDYKSQSTYYSYGKLLLTLLNTDMTNLRNVAKSHEQMYVAVSNASKEYKKYYRLRKQYEGHVISYHKSIGDYDVYKIDTILHKKGISESLLDIYDMNNKYAKDKMSFNKNGSSIDVDLFNNDYNRILRVSFCIKDASIYLYVGRKPVINLHNNNEIKGLFQFLRFASMSDELKYEYSNEGYILKSILDYETNSTHLNISYVIKHITELNRFQINVTHKEPKLTLISYNNDVANNILNHKLSADDLSKYKYGWFCDIDFSQLDPMRKREAWDVWCAIFDNNNAR